jgi:effector-binding domain-containing protein
VTGGDDSWVDYEVSLIEAESRSTAVIAAATTWQEFPALWGRLLGEVWDCLHAGGIDRGCPNIMLYLDGAPNVEVGVLLDRPCPLVGRVVASELPEGIAATTVHRGAFGDVGAAHEAVLGWCAAHGHQPGGIRWEIYGPHNEDPAAQWIQVYWLLPTSARSGDLQARTRSSRGVTSVLRREFYEFPRD